MEKSLIDGKIIFFSGSQSKKEVQRWEENKKWQKKLDAVKMKLKEKTEEVERLEKSNNMSKEIIKRMEKERVSLQSKIKGYATAS